MRKIYVIDTSVLVYDPNSIKEFKGNDIVIPIVVLDELDKLKKGTNAVAKNARVFIRLLDEISTRGEIHKGIAIDKQTRLIVDVSAQVAIGTDAEYGDNQILATANALQKRNKKFPVILVSRDINLRTRARSYGMKAEGYEKDKVDSLEMYQGFRTVKNEAAGVQLANGGFDNGAFGIDLHHNECIVIEDNSGTGIAVGRRIGARVKQIQGQSPWGVSGRSAEQAFALNLLLEPKIPLVTLIGKAGSGKTLCAVASALESVLERRRFDKIIIYRPIQSVGNDIGYLPGSMEEKLAPWMGAIMDSMEFCFAQKNKQNWKIAFDMYREKGMIEMEAITYIRGRSIPNAFILVDEAQNLSKEEVKTILTRAGQGTKIVLTGDVEQIDASHLDATNNGLTYVVEKFKDSELAGHVTFTRGERSPLATEAAEIL